MVGTGATLSVVGASGADPHSDKYNGNNGGAGGVIQIIASSGVISSEATMKLQKGNKTCTENEDSADGFLLIKGIENISAIDMTSFQILAKHGQTSIQRLRMKLSYQVQLLGSSGNKHVK